MKCVWEAPQEASGPVSCSEHLPPDKAAHQDPAHPQLDSHELPELSRSLSQCSVLIPKPACDSMCPGSPRCSPSPVPHEQSQALSPLTASTMELWGLLCSSLTLAGPKPA